MKIIKVLKVILVVLLIGLLSWISFHHIANYFAERNLKVNQSFVTINNHAMHYSKRGSGRETIIMLPGFGTPLPTIDFEPLIKKLEDDYSIYVIEPFGYGLSDVIDTERTIENISNELHDAIQQLDIDHYYIMGHSISGVYSIHYIDQYPNEVKGFIGIDTSVPLQDVVLTGNPKISYALLDFFGVYRLVSYLAPESFIPNELQDYYTGDQLDETINVMRFNLNNQNIASETSNMERTFKIASTLKLPKSLPVLVLLAQESIDEYPEWFELHERLYSDQDFYRSYTLEGSHYLHRTQADQIAEKVLEFTNK